MENPNLFLICFNAFIAVMGLLSLLAGALRGLIELFPERTPQTERALPVGRAAQTDTRVADPVIAVAIASAVNAIAPGARVTHIEEIR
ncbi:MAG: hypothetical protein IPL59_08570 [Candidatus Competibacteraceae bacterium]|uniref:Uncharacterized protein n=1 Tax=Candidatus Contendobacter odensis Run_B_J11 TaxID=1400861 RepID=A0A7U7J1F9_9GAMM|nr:hypothetical protein [Candidatus Contendobacter odensis]MBK8535175.1 hypothetical protein [Candidatus Competibacteraceae bacterium]MBK8754393.1 hypothetical protein [Candidatus Competibacteraceae bacterium]CDH43102.1 exported hypothetical protein [Candidatus Contendobacter odensis Run_B_J11]